MRELFARSFFLLRYEGVSAQTVFYTDSSAAMAAVGKLGICRAKHSRLRHTYVPGHRQLGTATTIAIAGVYRPRDMLSKPVVADTLAHLASCMPLTREITTMRMWSSASEIVGGARNEQ